MCADATPRQSDHQGLQLLVANRHARSRFGARPNEAPLVQSSRTQPNTDAVVYQRLNAIRSAIGEEVCVMRTCLTEHTNHPRQRRFRSGAHVDRLDRQPYRIDTDHRRSSRNQAAHSAPADCGQATLMSVAPRRSSMLIGWSFLRVGASTRSGMNDPLSTSSRAGGVLTVSIGAPGCARSSATTHRRKRFAFKLLARATAAIDTPGLRHAATTSALNSALCVRRRRRPSEVFTCPPRIWMDTMLPNGALTSKMGLPAGYVVSSSLGGRNETACHAVPVR